MLKKIIIYFLNRKKIRIFISNLVFCKQILIRYSIQKKFLLLWSLSINKIKGFTKKKIQVIRVKSIPLPFKFEIFMTIEKRTCKQNSFFLLQGIEYNKMK